MKKKIQHLFIILTPFQKTVIYQLFEEKLKLGNTLVLCSEYVNIEDIYSEYETLKNYKFSRERLFTQPFKYFELTRENVKKAKESINELHQRFEFSSDLEIYLGTDKDVFTQLFLNDLYKNEDNHKLTLVDEGLGYYVRPQAKDKLFSLIYRILTPVFFGSQLRYIKQLGSHPKINDVYLRAPELLQDKKKHINYIQFNLDNQNNGYREVSKGKVLLYSFPNQTYGISTSVKMEIITDIAQHLAKFNKTLVIKPHPREIVTEIQQLTDVSQNIQLLNHSLPGETLDYFDYELILNFFSSIIIDLLNKKYPKKRIFTIGFTKKPLITFDKTLKYCYIKDFKASKVINFT